MRLASNFGGDCDRLCETGLIGGTCTTKLKEFTLPIAALGFNEKLYRGMAVKKRPEVHGQFSCFAQFFVYQQFTFVPFNPQMTWIL